MTKRRIVQGNLVAIDSPALPPVVYHVCVKCGAHDVCGTKREGNG